MSGKLIDSLLNFLFPPFCVSCGRYGSWFCQRCQSKIVYIENLVCPMCDKPSVGGRTHSRCLKPHGLDGLLSMAHFETPLKEAIYGFKYHWVQKLGPILGELLVGYLNQIDWMDVYRFKVIPIPLDQKRQKWRGFNQTLLLAETICQELDLGLEENILVKNQTVPQAELKTVQERRQNLENAFWANKKISGSIFLLDDVYTTGSTLKNAAKALKRRGAKEVWGLTLARR